MTKNRFLILKCVPVWVASLMVVMQLGGCDNTPLEVSDNDRKYLDLNEIGITVIIGPDEATIILDISQEFRDGISLINYSMDEHDLVLKSPGQTRSVYAGSQLILKESHIVHLPDRIRFVIDCRKPI